MTPTPAPTPTPALRTPAMATITPMSPPRPVPVSRHHDHRDVAKSLPRDYGASLRDLAGMSLSPPRDSYRGFTSVRNHLGGSWDQLDCPRPQVAQLRASWDHLGPVWDQPLDATLDLSRGPDALLTHTLRPARHEVTSPRGQALEDDPASRDPGVLDLASPRDSVAGAKGLLNAPGQNNCFLNSAVQNYHDENESRGMARCDSELFCPHRDTTLFWLHDKRGNNRRDGMAYWRNIYLALESYDPS
ncbi:uncharacterized protein LOC119589398 [Penaeus monodon]|uniref:uncharacterized protein LOC119589398 n=1 Tax=Penaeus monodon TaxID=6687 RepID=UPI0018A76DDB|nr:uncharacterized protein LOC119589398 [Penaeus monodon]